MCSVQPGSFPGGATPPLLISKSMLVVLAIPFLVVMIMTPLDALDPYMAAAEASFKISMDAMSLKLISAKGFSLELPKLSWSPELITIPSNTYN